MCIRNLTEEEAYLGNTIYRLGIKTGLSIEQAKKKGFAGIQMQRDNPEKPDTEIIDEVIPDA